MVVEDTQTTHGHYLITQHSKSITQHSRSITQHSKSITQISRSITHHSRSLPNLTQVKHDPLLLSLPKELPHPAHGCLDSPVLRVLGLSLTEERCVLLVLLLWFRMHVCKQGRVKIVQKYWVRYYRLQLLWGPQQYQMQPYNFHFKGLFGLFLSSRGPKTWLGPQQYQMQPYNFYF